MTPAYALRPFVIENLRSIVHTGVKHKVILGVRLRTGRAVSRQGVMAEGAYLVFELIIAGMIGFLIGMRFRVAGLLAASVLLVIANMAAVLAGIHPTTHVVWDVFIQLVALQAAYLCGLVAYSKKKREGAGKRFVEAPHKGALMKSRRS